MKALLAGIMGERLHAPCLLSLMGLWPAEVCGLRWSDVDFTAGTIAAGENTRTLVDGEIEERPVKSAAGKRGLPMPATAAKALKAFQTLQEKERLKAGDAHVDSGYVLVDELGQPQRTDWLRRRVKGVLAPLLPPPTPCPDEQNLASHRDDPARSPLMWIPSSGVVQRVPRSEHVSARSAVDLSDATSLASSAVRRSTPGRPAP